MYHQLNILYLDKKKLQDSLKKFVFKIVITSSISSNAQIFMSRFINQMKNSGIDKIYKKS